MGVSAGNHLAILGFYGDGTCVVGLDGETAVPACCVGAERGGDRGAAGHHSGVGPHLLFGDLSAGHSAGCVCVVRQEGKAESLHILEGEELDEVCDAGGVRGADGAGTGWCGYTDCSL